LKGQLRWEAKGIDGGVQSVIRFVRTALAWYGAAVLAGALGCLAYGLRGAAAGLALGGAASAIYLVLLAWQAARAGAMPPGRAAAYIRGGFAARLALIAGAAVPALALWSTPGFFGAMAGFAGLRAAIWALGFAYAKQKPEAKSRNRNKR